MEGSWGFEHTKKVFLEEVIPFINSLRASFKDFDYGLHSELNEVKTVFNQMEAAVEHCFVDKKYFDIQKKEIFFDNDRLLEHIIYQDVMNIVKNDAVESAPVFHVNNNKYAKYVSIAKLKKHIENLKGKNVVEKDATPNNAKVIAPEMFKLDLEPLSPKEVLVYVTATCPSLTKPSEKLVAITQLNKNKKVRWKPTRRTFTIDGNTCPLNRLTSTKVVPLMETTSKLVITQNPEVKVVQIVLWYLDSGCSKHMTGNRSQLINFVHKFLGHNLFLVGQFCNSDHEVAFRKHTCYIRDLEGVELLKGSRGSNLYTLSLEDMMLSSPICLLSKASKTKSWLWHRSEDLGKMKPEADIGIFVGYAPAKKAFRIYNKRTHLIIKTIHVDFDELIAMASEQFSLGPGPYLLTPGSISSGLVPNPPSPTLYVPPTKKGWDILFQLMFNEYFNPPPSVASHVPAIVAPEPADSTGTSSSTTIDQDAPSLNSDPFFGAPFPELNFKESSSRDVIPTNVHSVNQPPEHLRK
ncbi:hypothetical protein Tco_0024233 [Tanacetum coccineum]